MTVSIWQRWLAVGFVLQLFLQIEEHCIVVLDKYRECPSHDDAKVVPPGLEESTGIHRWREIKNGDFIEYFNLSPRSVLLYREAYAELGMTNVWLDHDFALYPRRYYERVNEMLATLPKIHDFCFIGSLFVDLETLENRAWILAIADRLFTNSSFFQLSDFGPRHAAEYSPRGVWDRTLERDNFVPKTHKTLEGRDAFDEEYFATMSKCKFCLAPAGDLPFSMRFYEVLMTKCIPVVNKKSETFRSRAESELPYKYYLAEGDPSSFEYNPQWVDENYQLFLRHHTLSDPNETLFIRSLP